MVLLNEDIDSSGSGSVRERIKKGCQQYKFNGKISASDEEKFFKSGGKFSADELHTLKNMLNELETITRSFKKAVNMLVKKVNEYR